MVFLQANVVYLFLVIVSLFQMLSVQHFYFLCLDLIFLLFLSLPPSSLPPSHPSLPTSLPPSLSLPPRPTTFPPFTDAYSDAQAILCPVSGMGTACPLRNNVTSFGASMYACTCTCMYVHVTCSLLCCVPFHWLRSQLCPPKNLAAMHSRE